jgi:methionyl-tRNA formyltransferase
VVVAFGRIIKSDVLDALPLVNAHFSLLPRWRGAAPVERAILAGDEETGVCLMAIDEGLDSGPVYRCERTPIGADETAAGLRARLSAVAADLLVESLDRGLGTPAAQQGEATYANKIEVSDLHLDWNRSATELHRVVRLGRAWTTWRGRRLLVWSALPVEAPAALPPGQLDGDVVATGDGGLRLLIVQPEGRSSQSAEEWRRGARLRPGEALGQ